MNEWSKDLVNQRSLDLIPFTPEQHPIGPIQTNNNNNPQTHWIYTLQDIGDEDGWCNYQAIFSRPTRSNPIPASTACIQFRFFPGSIKRIEYQFETQYLVYKLSLDESGQWKGNCTNLV